MTKLARLPLSREIKFVDMHAEAIGEGRDGLVFAVASPPSSARTRTFPRGEQILPNGPAYLRIRNDRVIDSVVGP